MMDTHALFDRISKELHRRRRMSARVMVMFSLITYHLVITLLFPTTLKLQIRNLRSLTGMVGTTK